VQTSNDLQVALATLPGVAIVPDGYRELFTDGVVFRSFTPATEAMGLWFWWRKGDDSAVTAFREALRATGERGRKPRGR